jgi:hypothetical protein
MKKSIFTLAFLLFVAVQIFAQAPQTINFQAVARKPNGDPNANVTVQVQFIIRNNDPQNGLIVYNSGSQNLPTDACGMFTAKIGALNQSQFSQIDWATSTKYLEVKADGLTIGNQQMVSVPYALYAEKTNLQAGNSGISVSGNTISNQGDLSNTNEIQTISLSGNTVSLSSNGGSFQLPQDGDGSPTNEIQTLSVSGSSLTLSNGGGTVNLPVPPAYVPDIAMFEERKQNGVAGGTSLNGAFNTRILNTTVKSSSSVSLDINSGLMTFANGTYIITASAPALQADRHRLCLRTNNDVIVLRGTSELSNDDDASATRSFIQGVLTVPDNGTIFKLDHFIDSNTGGAGQLGAPTIQVPGQETYSQIMIQKVQ